MGEIRLTAESIQHIALFENMTRAKILDCIAEEERLVYVVKHAFLEQFHIQGLIRYVVFEFRVSIKVCNIVV